MQLAANRVFARVVPTAVKDRATVNHGFWRPEMTFTLEPGMIENILTTRTNFGSYVFTIGVFLAS